jgi:hypothetical protein
LAAGYWLTPLSKSKMSQPNQIIKVSDEGTPSPFTTRLFIGLLELRDQFFLSGVSQRERLKLCDQFDNKFKPMIDAAHATRDAALEIRDLTSSHIDAIQSGRIVEFKATQYNILQTIDSPLSQSVDKLLDQSIVATKSGLQSMLRDLLRMDIGYFFGKDLQFNNSIAALITSGDGTLAHYLKDVRSEWHSALQTLRIQHEHHGWYLDGVTYHLTGPSQVTANLPKVLGLPVDIFARHTANRVLLFIENMMVFALLRYCRFPIYAVEIPRERRDPLKPQRFGFAVKGFSSATPWIITYKDDLDFV